MLIYFPNDQLILGSYWWLVQQQDLYSAPVLNYTQQL